ncbi:aminotransferase class I/II-fold pyridoxal phosphate-dependent enzyme [Legionella longbeachae]|uniref:aminotransferase class I/II-fold pyridoxal phosphate-dependent enzyme n=1 Tax=Legionella longbeachae TaxID=450 RepID=UPI00124661BD|nr:aminotransferase class I/II-fold pyridoxal phosphate-dependent enzyme [Legionella longbeachae]QEY52891.1 aminotransferase class I/II-fold pyridoxal phosphate-dependent enzyme [Legionella longbeachae]
MNKLKDGLIKMALSKRQMRLKDNANNTNHELLESRSSACHIPERFYRFEDYPNYQTIKQKQIYLRKLNISSPFFLTHEGTASATSVIQGTSFINFSSYNYLNLNGDARVNAAAQDAIQRYGTSASASRLVSGERPIHQQLESALSKMYGVESALIFVSGHATNVTTIGYLFGPKDLIIHDELIHDSSLQGIKLSGAFRLSFPHNNWQALEDILITRRHEFERVLIIIEGLYSMDGDYPDLPAFIDLKKRYKTFLMIDEAHSIGVLGSNGKGIHELFGIKGNEVDIWMGTLSKSLAGCGGYIAGSQALVEHLKFSAPGFLYSVGMSPPLAAASLKALEIMLEEPERVTTLKARSTQFLEEAKALKLNTGFSAGQGIIPILCGSSKRAILLSSKLYEKNINVQPIIYPAVPDNQARLRFFISSAHTEAQISDTVNEIAHHF